MVHARNARSRGAGTGFTLVELMVVVMIIVVFLAVAAPALAPMLNFASLESSARNLASFGARAMDHCILARDRFTVQVDLANQEYWAMRWPKITEQDKDAERLTGGSSLFGQDAGASFQDMLAGLGQGGEMKPEDMEKQAEALFAEMELYHRTVLETRARRVLDQEPNKGASRLFDERFSLEREDDDKVEVREPLMTRTKLPQGIRLVRVVVGEKSYSSGVVDIEITPVGLQRPVSFEIRDEEGETYTVKWMGNTRQGVIESGWTGPVTEESGT